MAYLIHTIAGSPPTIFLKVLFLLMQPKIAIIIFGEPCNHGDSILHSVETNNNNHCTSRSPSSSNNNYHC